VEILSVKFGWILDIQNLQISIQGHNHNYSVTVHTRHLVNNLPVWFHPSTVDNGSGRVLLFKDSLRAIKFLGIIPGWKWNYFKMNFPCAFRWGIGHRLSEALTSFPSLWEHE
jgi:hypothetical protein